MTFNLNEEKRLMLESIQKTGDGFFYDPKDTGMALGADANRRSKYIKDKMQLGGEYDKADDHEYLLALAGPVKEEANNPEAVAQVHEGDPVTGEESDLGRMLNGEKLAPNEAKQIHMDVARDMLFDGGLGPWHHPMMGSEAEYARDADQPVKPEKLPLSDMNKEFLQTASEEMLANALMLHREQAAKGDEMSAALVPILEKVLAGRFGQIKRSFDINAAIASRDQTFTPEPVQRADTEAFQRMGLFGKRRKKNIPERPAEPRLEDVLALVLQSGTPDAAEVADRMRAMRSKGYSDRDVLGEFDGRLKNIWDPERVNRKPEGWKNWTPRDIAEELYEPGMGGLITHHRGPSDEELMEENDESAKYAQQNYGQPAEARLDQPDARDSSS